MEPMDHPAIIAEKDKIRKPAITPIPPMLAQNFELLNL
jgi:hypothetical protein